MQSAKWWYCMISSRPFALRCPFPSLLPSRRELPSNASTLSPSQRPPQLTVKPKIRKPHTNKKAAEEEDDSLEAQQERFRAKQAKKAKLEMEQVRLDAIQAYKDLKARRARGDDA